MRKKTNIVKLTDEQKEQLNALINKGKHSARVIKRARVLLLGEQDMKDKETAQIVGYTAQQVKNIRKRFCLEGLESTLKERPRPGAPKKLSDKAEKVAIAIACSDAPEGRTSWTMQMIADKLVELRYVESISEDTIRLRLKKTR